MNALPNSQPWRQARALASAIRRRKNKKPMQHLICQVLLKALREG